MSYKSYQRITQSTVNQLEKNLVKLKKQEAAIRAKWSKNNQKAFKKQEDILNLKRLGTKRHKKLKEWLKSWKWLSDELTDKRDKVRESIKRIEQKLIEGRNELERAIDKEREEKKTEDELVNIIFSLNDDIAAATQNMNNILTNRLYRRLIKNDGSLHSQVSIYSADGLKKIVAMVNSITIILPELAEQAMEMINSFFKVYEARVVKMDELTKSLFELTRKLLVEKKKFKIGPDLYRFLSLNIDSKKFPELRGAQRLLGQSLRSEKTDSYIRLYVRENTVSKWVPQKRR